MGFEARWWNVWTWSEVNWGSLVEYMCVCVLNILRDLTYRVYGKCKTLLPHRNLSVLQHSSVPTALTQRQCQLFVTWHSWSFGQRTIQAIPAPNQHLLTGNHWSGQPRDWKKMLMSGLEHSCQWPTNPIGQSLVIKVTSLAYDVTVPLVTGVYTSLVQQRQNTLLDHTVSGFRKEKVGLSGFQDKQHHINYETYH